jgi:DNA-binding beta-propeller fold protein YncE
MRKAAVMRRQIIRSAGYQLPLPEGVIADATGNLYIADRSQHLVRRVTPEGNSVTLVGPPELAMPTGLALDSTGPLYVSDGQCHRVLKVGPEGALTTAAGTGVAGCSGDGGPAAAARLREPWGLAVDRYGSLYIADAGNHRVRRVAPDGLIFTVAGVGRAGFSGEGGPATAAELDRPLDVAVDDNGNLFLVDSLNGRIRKVGIDGVITTVFHGGGTRDGAAAQHYPARVAVDDAGNLLIADPFQHRVITITGVAARAAGWVALPAPLYGSPEVGVRRAAPNAPTGTRVRDGRDGSDLAER